MKHSIFFLFVLCFLSLSETKAQSSDTLQRISLMKKKSKRFIAKITTNEGVKIGLLYAADSAGITLLDSNYDKHFYSIEELKTLQIKRVNPFGYAFNTMFHTGLFVGGAFTTIFLFSGFYSASAGSLGLFFAVAFPISVVVFGALVGVIIGAVNSEIPFINYKEFKSDKYKKALRYIKLKTQEYLVKTHGKPVN
jgi:hypothetical protein